VQRAVETLRKGELIGIGQRLIAKDQHRVLVHSGADSIQSSRTVGAAQIGSGDFGGEQGMQRAKYQVHAPQPRRSLRCRQSTRTRCCGSLSRTSSATAGQL
jgi:hypothetical protein